MLHQKAHVIFLSLFFDVSGRPRDLVRMAVVMDRSWVLRTELEDLTGSRRKEKFQIKSCHSRGSPSKSLNAIGVVTLVILFLSRVVGHLSRGVGVG